MSLTSLLNHRDVKTKFKEIFPKPKLIVNKALLAPPLTNHYLLTGTAFDYLMRFFLKHLNPKAITFRWIAEIAQLQTLSLHKYVYDIDDDKLTDETPPEDKEIIETSEKIIAKAQDNYKKFLMTGRINKNLIRSALLLAQLDPLYRGGYVDEYILNNFGTVADKDIKDLKNLISLVDPKTFKAKKVCLLNPTFGKASKMVGGADVDLVLDDMIIEIKTTKNLQLTRDFFNQLIGYYLLYKIGSIDKLPSKHNIRRLCIYYARYGYLYLINSQDVIDDKSYENLYSGLKRE
jgi:hypothetical protein